MSSDTITTAFCILVGLSVLGVFLILEYGISSGPHGGAVGAWLLVLPLLLLFGTCIVFTQTSSPGVRAVCLQVAVMVFLPAAGLTVKLLVLDPMKAREDAQRRVRAASGVDIFPEPAQVELLKAVREHNVAKVKALLPAVGDLNKRYGETTLFLFALERGEDDPSAADLEILEAMLKAGANPNVPPGRALFTAYARGGGVKLVEEVGGGQDG